jgi:hypothetical protein
MHTNRLLAFYVFVDADRVLWRAVDKRHECPRQEAAYRQQCEIKWPVFLTNLGEFRAMWDGVLVLMQVFFRDRSVASVT